MLCGVLEMQLLWHEELLDLVCFILPNLTDQIRIMWNYCYLVMLNQYYEYLCKFQSIIKQEI